MRSILYKADDRGKADYGWLKANYTFSFSSYYNPKNVNFGKLRVFNDDLIKGGGGFETHPHDNMEIITIPLSGSLVHEDSMGNGGVINTGDVQIMSAGTGIEHSEKNNSSSEDLNLFQIWIFPKQKDIAPRYEQKSFDASQRKGELQLLVSPLKTDEALWINQDVYISRIDLEKDQDFLYKVKHTSNGVFLLVIDGAVTFRNTSLSSRDAIGIMDVTSFEFSASKASQILLLDVPLH